MSELRCRPVALLMLIMYLGACYSWRPTTVSPRVVVEEEQPSKIRVTSTRGDITVMPDPGIVNDSLVSLQERCQTGVVAVDGELCPAMMALDEVRSLDVARIDPGKTTAFVALSGLVTVLFIGLAWAMSGGIGGSWGSR